MTSTEIMEVLRLAGKCERRCIMRQALGYYRAVVITGLYVQQLKDASPGGLDAELFIPALKHCIAAHPILSTVVRGEETEAPEFVRPATLDLHNHIEIWNPSTVEGEDAMDEARLLKKVTIEKLDEAFSDIDRIPPWKIVVFPLSTPWGSSERKFYILFSFSHSHGDGKSGLAFHKSFIKGLEMGHLTYDSNTIHESPSSALLPPIEEACNLKITLPYLLGPFLGTYMPKFLARMFNIHSSATPQAPNSWIGTPASYDPDYFHTGLEIVVIEKETLSAILAACRAHGAKLTGLLHQMLVRAMSQALPADTPAGNFVSETAVDLRHLVPDFSDDFMGLCISAVYEVFPRIDNTSMLRTGDKDVVEAMWASARSSTARLAAGANTLVDQPIGLLKYLANFKMWLMGQIGKPHESSYGVSNILAFDPFASDPERQTTSWDIERMVFAQSANPISSPLCIQVVSRKGGDMVIALTWQLGVLGVPDEDSFVAGIGDGVKELISIIAFQGA